MKHVHWLTAHPYTYSVLIYIGTWKEFHRYMKKSWNLDMGDQEFYGGMSQAISNKAAEYATIWLPRWENNPADISTLSHELNHMCFRMFDKIGIKVREGKKNEAFCYTQDDLLQRALETLNA